MATTPKPTILKPAASTVNPDAAVGNESAPSFSATKERATNLRWIILGVGGALLFATLAAGGWWWKRHARSHAASWVPTKSTQATAVPPKATSNTPAATVQLPLEPFVVNLADAGGHGYARIGLTLRLAAPDGAAAKDAAKKDSPDATGDLRDVARDTVISVLSQQQSADLLAPGGKDHLKELLRQAMRARDPRLQVVDIYFTEFLVQS